MTSHKSELISKILNRGTETVVPNQEALKKVLESDHKLNIYLGIDPTATHIHLGHAVPLRKLQYFAELGHTVYFLIGDFTALIGDTSDKNSERPMLTKEIIEENFQTYKQQASKLVDFSKIKIVHNSDWLSKLGFGDLLQLTSLFSVNDFISRELIRGRLNDGNRVSLTEVLYPIMQGYDSYHLQTDVQLGGSDQIFNMQAGRTMLKKLSQKESFVLSNQFLLGTDGRKMSKSWGNAIWLDDTPEEIFGKVMSLNDDLIFNYFSFATDLSDQEIEEIKAAQIQGIHPMELKKMLGRQIVKELYGSKAVAEAEAHFSNSVQKKIAPDDTLEVNLASEKISIDNLLSLLVDSQLVSSRSEARRLWDQGALYLNEQRIENSATDITFGQKPSVVRVGKRKYLKISVT